MRRALRSRLLFILIFTMLTAAWIPLTASSADDAVMALDFTKLPDNTEIINGSISVEKNALKEEAVLTVSKESGGAVAIPLEKFTGDSLTIAGWFKVGTDTANSASMLELYRDENNFMTVIPYSTKYHNGLSVRLTVGGTKLRGAQSADNILNRGSNTSVSPALPKAEGLLPLYDAWAHYAYVLTPEGLSYYVNGNLRAVYKSKLDISSLTDSGAKLVLGASLADDCDGFVGAFSDLRLYDTALDGEALKGAYHFGYMDFLTTSYDFEDGTAETVRGYNGTLAGNAKIGKAYDSESNVLILDGSRLDGTNATASAMIIPPQTLLGHGNFTISFDVCTDSNTAAYAYIMSFAPNSSQMFLLGARFAGGPSTLLKFTRQLSVKEYHCSIPTTYDTWERITISLDGKTCCIYVNGVLAAKNEDFVYSDSIFWNGKSPLAFGKLDYFNDTPYMGAIDNIKIWSYALSESDVYAENGLIADDLEAIEGQIDSLSLNYDPMLPVLPYTYQLDQGVRVEWSTDHPEMISREGLIIPPKEATPVKVTATLLRGEASVTKIFDITVASASSDTQFAMTGTPLSDVSFTEDSHYKELMTANLDYMMSLSTERLLYNYRKTAGLDTGGYESYTGWITENGGGAGQFEGMYITALAKASQTMPDYTYEGESVLERLTYMIGELVKCRDAYAEKYPDEAGYIGAIPVDCYDGLAEGRTVSKEGVAVWVPWYMIHKTFEMEYAVYAYAADENLRQIAYDMMDRHASWCAKKMDSYTPEQIETIRTIEYGGMPEVLNQIYGATGNPDHYRAAYYFTNRSLLDPIYNNVDVLKGLHANTTIPKFLGCAAAYEATGIEYYKTICINAFEMIYSRIYANGSTSNTEHWFDDPGELETDWDTSETCVSYNMLKLTDYLYRWTGDVKYLDYFETTLINHILTSMDPNTGLKTYYVPTQFGLHKCYHTPDTSFYCCACTGMESFAKLSYGLYYKDGDDITVAQYFPSTYRINDNLTITQSEDYLLTEQATFTIEGSGNFTLRLRNPKWSENVELVLNGETIAIPCIDGFYEISRKWKDGDSLQIRIPFDYRLESLNSTTNRMALMYGPMLLVLDLGPNEEIDITFSQIGSDYKGKIADSIKLPTADISANMTLGFIKDQMIFNMENTNQGKLKFRPFWQLFHNRYGMYVHYSFGDGAEKAAKDKASAVAGEIDAAAALFAGKLSADAITAENIEAIRTSYTSVKEASSALDDIARARLPEDAKLKLKAIGAAIDTYDIGDVNFSGSDNVAVIVGIGGGAVIILVILAVVLLKKKKKA
ncbi:MAG: glycoside hydrolase family 127 protein [Clostridia bacterium]|nr:glycoside hydrolase family 127 protein [Clostridia bacterium]